MRSAIQKVLILSGCFLLLLKCGCENEKKYLLNKIVPLPSSGWKYDDIKTFSFSVTDTSQPYDLFLHVRNKNEYQYQNLWVDVTIISPVEVFTKERVNVILADEYGNWKGEGGRNVNTMLHPFLENYKFPYLGIYSLELQHAMRDSTLQNISDIGIQITAVKK